MEREHLNRLNLRGNFTILNCNKIRYNISFRNSESDVRGIDLWQVGWGLAKKISDHRPGQTPIYNRRASSTSDLQPDNLIFENLTTLLSQCLESLDLLVLTLGLWINVLFKCLNVLISATSLVAWLKAFKFFNV